VEISDPMNVSHAQITLEDLLNAPEFEVLFIKAGISKNDLEDPSTKSFVVKTVRVSIENIDKLKRKSTSTGPTKTVMVLPVFNTYSPQLYSYDGDDAPPPPPKETKPRPNNHFRPPIPKSFTNFTTKQFKSEIPTYLLQDKENTSPPKKNYQMTQNQIAPRTILPSGSRVGSTTDFPNVEVMEGFKEENISQPNEPEQTNKFPHLNVGSKVGAYYQDDNWYEAEIFNIEDGPNGKIYYIIYIGYENAVYQLTQEYIYPLETEPELKEPEPENQKNFLETERDSLVERLRTLTLAETEDLAKILQSAFWEYKNKN